MKYRHLIILTIACTSWAILAVECNPPGICPDYHGYHFTGMHIDPDEATFGSPDWTFQLMLDMVKSDSVQGSLQSGWKESLFPSALATMPCDEPPYSIPLSKRTMLSQQPLIKGADTIPPGTDLLSGGTYFSSHYISQTRKESPDAPSITDTVEFHLEPMPGVRLMSGITHFVFSVTGAHGDTISASFEVQMP